jgi:GH25 family lysozyme M1 (1,4-beta-N-acetylmuramidase)
MFAVQEYFNEMTIKLLDKLIAKQNQKVIITVTDEFIDPENTIQVNNIRGTLAQYANPALIEKERGAWEQAAGEKHCNI